MNHKHYSELLPAHKVEGKMIVNIKGTNGSGKSTVPQLMREIDEEFFTIWCDTFGQKEIIATVFPQLGWLALGSYHNKCGGCDGLDSGDIINQCIRLTWLLDYNVLFEGVIVADIKSTYHNLLHSINNDPRYPKRRTIMLFPTTPLEECLRRVSERNGGKPVKEDLIATKYANNMKAKEWYLQEGKLEVLDLDTSGEREEMLQKFLETVGEL